MDKVAYLGPDGSFSHKAAKLLAPEAEAFPQASFAAVANALISGGANWAVLPIQNSLNGGVMQNLDLLQSCNCVAVKSVILPIEHRLVTLKGAKKSEIKRIYSHSQALGQCSQFLAADFPEAELVPVSSTSLGAKMVKTPYEAAIASADCEGENLEFSKENIADEKDNFTCFLLVREGVADENAQSGHVYFSVTCPHEAGALVKILNVLKDNDINMTKIESRPIKDRLGEFRFFIEIEGDYASTKIKSALAELKNLASSFKLLGTY